MTSSLLPEATSLAAGTCGTRERSALRVKEPRWSPYCGRLVLPRPLGKLWADSQEALQRGAGKLVPVSSIEQVPHPGNRGTVHARRDAGHAWWKVPPLRCSGRREGSSQRRLHLPPPPEDVTSAKATSPQRCRWPPVTTCRGDRSGSDPAQPRPRERPPWALLDVENN